MPFIRLCENHSCLKMAVAKKSLTNALDDLRPQRSQSTRCATEGNVYTKWEEGRD